MKLDDPSATYRGYRRQALYVLYRLLVDALGNDSAVGPESVEDLAIYGSDGTLAEVVQVKDHGANLTASSFKPFFYERIAPFCDSDSKVLVRVASFGPIGPDLLAAKAGDPVARKRIIETISKDREVERLTGDGAKKSVKPGVSVDQATRIIDHVRFERVDEATLTEGIMKALSESVVGVSPSDAFAFLMWWMLSSAEFKDVIRRREAVHKLSHIGEFLAGRNAFQSEWYRSIVPLSEDKIDTTQESRSKLKLEFFRGGRVRFDHILADVDVLRTVPLTTIHQAFFKSNVVIVHSASGQGKTTLALRYLKELAPAAFRLQIKPAEGLNHARQMALAIRKHAEAINVPTIIFVDVRPGDGHWVELVRELSSEELIRVLVTIREEDWQRSNPSAVDFFFDEMGLEFDESEARSLFDSLREQQLAAHHIDFEEAWSQFGQRKTLLEFVYFVTQAETLAQRIVGQVRAFQDDVRTGKADPNEESLLRLVAVASTYEARLDLTRTLAKCGIASPIETLRRFEDEYFIRQSNNGRLLDGYHAIRSAILSECLTDPVVVSWDESAAQALLLMEESDLEPFLLCAFSRRPDAVSGLTSGLNAFEPATWPGVCGIIRSLMWLGLREYWDANRAVVDEAFAENPGGWWLLFDSDVGQVLGDGAWNIFENLGEMAEAAAARSRYFRARQLDKAIIFSRVRDWLDSRSGSPVRPTEQRDWMSLAEVMFWCGHLGVEWSVDLKIDSYSISDATGSLPLYLVGDFLLGMRKGMPDVVSAWLSTHGDELSERLRREAAIVKLDESDDSVVGHFIIDLETDASRLRREFQSDQTTKASLHDLCIERVLLLSQVYVGKEKYGAVGYGHRLSILATPFDDAAKPGVLASNIHPQWATRFNSLSRGLSERRFRPPDWRAFFAGLNELREQLLRCLADLRLTLERARQSPTAHVFIQNTKDWDNCRKAFNGGLLFPTTSVDEWGFVTESMASTGHLSAQSKRQATVIRFGEFGRVLGEFVGTVSNFLTQCIDALCLAPALRNATNAEQRKRVLDSVQQLGVKENSIRLSVMNGCDAWAALRRLHFAFRESASLQKWLNQDLEAREQREFLETISVWTSFVYPPKRRNPGKRPSRREPFDWVLQPIRNRLRDNLQALRRRRIVARIVPNVIIWDGKPGLWITANVDHPVTSMRALGLVWDAVRKSFDSSTESPVRYSATNLAWEEIVVVTMVGNRSLARRVHRHFKAAAFREDLFVDEMEWILASEPVPEDLWDEIGLDCWDAPAAISSMDQFVASYGLLLHHVEHMADFKRIPSTDQLGSNILQGYLRRESLRAEPMLQAAYDAYFRILKLSSSLGDLRSSPNLLRATEALLDLKRTIRPRDDERCDSEESATYQLSIDEIVEWRDRLAKGLEAVECAELFWAAHALKCPAVTN
jgi:hypothetical protein